jgi:hypothetical protein
MFSKVFPLQTQGVPKKATWQAVEDLAQHNSFDASNINKSSESDYGMIAP